MLRKIWTDFFALMVRRPPRYQVAALCWHNTADGPRVLLVTSLTTERWVLPKGWPKMGQDGGGTALEEAWEEAGIRIENSRPEKIGRYTYHKRLAGDVPVHTVVDVYAIEVHRLLDSYPEMGQRRREWFAPDDAAKRVDEPGLAQVLRGCADQIAALRVSSV